MSPYRTDHRPTRRAPRSTRRTKLTLLRFEELERRRLLATYTVNDYLSDDPLDPSVGPAMTAIGTITLRSAIQQIDIDGGGEIDFESNLGPISQWNNALEPAVTVPAVINGGSVGRVALFLQLVLSGNGITVENMVVSGAVPADEIVVSGDDDVLENDALGTDFYNPEQSGEGSYPNGGYGALIYGSNNTVSGCVISGNAISGIAIDGGSNNVIVGNHIGTDAAGTTAIPNAYGGVEIYGGASDNTIGGTSQALGNLISGNAGPATDAYAGVAIFGSGTTGNVVEGNLIGTDITGSVALGNANAGVSISGGATDNTIGGMASGVANLISGNGSISSSYPGVQITGSGTTGNVVAGNFIGTDFTGTTALGNCGDGVVISNGASDNTIGGTTVASRNVISGNSSNGIEITGAGSSNNLVAGNAIGTNYAGTVAIPNGTAGSTSPNSGCGVLIDSGATDNTIGGTVLGSTNLVSGNFQNGIRIDGTGTSGNVVEGNYIGIDSSGTVAIPNGTTGSTSPNTGCGVLIDSGAGGNTIGGTMGATVSGNVISGNIADGVLLTGSDTTGNVVEGNYIGTDSNFVQTDPATGAVSGDMGIGNGGDGVHITDSSSNNMIGGTDGADDPADAMDGNIIAFNAMNGVAVDSGTGNTIREDLFIDNGGSAFSPGAAPSPPFLPIALGGNATQLNPNSSTAQQGANNLENYPIVTVSYNTPNEIQVFNQSATDVTVEVYCMVQEVAPGGIEAGDQLLGVETVGANATAQFEEPDISADLQQLPFDIVGTATDSVGNTSQFGVALTPAQVRTAYGINDLPYDGTGQTIAIVSEGNDPNLLTDLDTFDQQFGINNTGPTLFQQYGPASNFVTVFNQGGAPDAGAIGEEVLDVEWAHAIAPGARIDVVEGTDFLASVPIAAALPGVSVVSISFGENEVGAPQPTGRTEATVSADEEQQHDADFIASGVVFLAASGDYGLFDKSYPAFSPYVVAVGGTTLTLNGDGTYSSEEGWGDGAATAADGGSGGGQSLFEAEPGYQFDVQTTGFRTIPDVSIIGGTDVAIADSYNQQAGNPGWGGEHGTSLATPVWAGLVALVDQGRADAGEAAFNSNNPEQIQEALYSLPAADFHSPADLGGDNGTTDAGLLDPDRYDEVTGLGSPIVSLLVPDLINDNSDQSDSNPAVTVSTNALDLGSTTQGTAGSPRTFTVSGSGLTAGITLTAPAGVELSNNGGATYSPTLDLPQTDGAVASSTIDVRISATAPVGSISGNIAVGSTGVTEQDVVVSGTVSVLSGSATIYTVNSTGNSPTDGSGTSGTLPYLIAQANANTSPAGSEITFDPTVFGTPQTIELADTLVLSETAGPEVVDAAGVSTVTISGGNSVGVIEVDAGTTADVTLLTISDGLATQGGGIDNGGTLTLVDVTLSSNRANNGIDTAGSGGAIYNAGTLSITGGTLSGNAAIEYGGGIYNDGGDVKVSDGCSIAGNGIFGVGGTSGIRYVADSGGGIYVSGGKATIAGSTVKDNTAIIDGGGIYVESGSLTITSGTLSGNTVYSEGGGIYDHGGDVKISDDCSIASNSVHALMFTTSRSGTMGRSGGGVYESGGKVTIEGSTVKDNTAPINGGGVYIESGSLTITGGAVSGDAAQGSGGGICEFGGDVAIIGCRLSGNTAGFEGGGLDDKGGSMTISASTLSGNTVGNGGLGAGVCDGSGDVTISDGCSIADNGTAQKGVVGGGIFDDGDVTITDSTLADNTASKGGGVFAAAGSLAIADATLSGNTATDDGGGIYQSGNAAKVTIVGSTLKNNTGLDFGGGVYADGGSLTISASTLSANTAGSEGGGIDQVRGAVTIITSTLESNAADWGGGLSVNNGSLSMSESAVSGNTAGNDASDSTPGEGGGIYESGGTVTISTSTLRNNTASQGGGLYLNNGSSTITASTFTGNTAGVAGGGVFNDDDFVAANCTIFGNDAGAGGGLDNDGTASLTACTISGNSATNSGGGIYSYWTTSLTDTIVAGNTGPAGADDISGIDSWLVTGSYNLIGTGGSGGITGGTSGNIVLTSLNDLHLGPLANNGGPTETMALAPGSAAIGAGTEADYPNTANPITIDQRGSAARQASRHWCLSEHHIAGANAYAQPDHAARARDGAVRPSGDDQVRQGQEGEEGTGAGRAIQWWRQREGR